MLSYFNEVFKASLEIIYLLDFLQYHMKGKQQVSNKKDLSFLQYYSGGNEF